MPKTHQTSEIRPLTSLRAVAAGIVVFFHYYIHHYGDPMPYWLSPIGQQGYFAVDIFFVLSGFVLTVRYAAEIRSREFQWREYLRRRVARIWPLYYVILLTWIFAGTQINWSNLTFTQGFFFGLVGTGNDVAWTLTIEESFYLLLPLILMTVVQRHSSVRLAVWSIVGLTVGVLLVIVSNVIGLRDNFYGFMYSLRFMADRTVFGYLPEFALGIVGGLWFERYGAPGRAKAWLLIIVGALGILGTLVYTSSWIHYDVQPFGWMIGIFSALLMVGLCNPQTVIARVMSHPFPVYLGRISFALYLLHTGPLVAISRTLPSPLFYAFGNIIAAIFHELVEKPGHKFVMALGRHKPNNPSSVQIAKSG